MSTFLADTLAKYEPVPVETARAKAIAKKMAELRKEAETR